MSAFMPEVDHEDEARRRKHKTTRTMAAAKEMRHWDPEAHIGDDEYILADVKAMVAEATAGKTDEQEMRTVERINRKGGGANVRRPGQRRANARRPGQRRANARRRGQRRANARRPGIMLAIHATPHTKWFAAI
eukprot:jgi/Tetstr1/465699/TSEL_000890.t1